MSWLRREYRLRLDEAEAAVEAAADDEPAAEAVLKTSL